MGKIFSPQRKFRNDLGCRAQSFSINFARKKTHFLDSQEKSHEVTWASPRLEKFINLMRVNAAQEKLSHARARKGMAKVCANIYAKLNKCIEDFQATF